MTDAKPLSHEPPSRPGEVLSHRLGGRIRVLETWFDEDPASLDHVDLWVSHRRSQPVSAWGWLYFYTLHVDLTQSPQALLKNLRASTAKGIRLARDNDNLTCAFNTSPTEADIEAFARHYDEHPLRQDQNPVDRARLLALKKAGFVNLAEVHTTEGTVLVRHFLLCHERSAIVEPVYQVSLLYWNAADPEKAKAIGRANRFLYFSEFLFYRERGYRIYDQNGWYAGTEDQKRLQINLFKEGFNGRIHPRFDCEEPVSLRGWAYVTLKTLKRWLLEPETRKEHRRRRHKAPRLPQVVQA